MRQTIGNINNSCESECTHCVGLLSIVPRTQGCEAILIEILQSNAHRTHKRYHRAIACRGIGTHCRGYLVVSNLPAHTNDDAIKSCLIRVGECFMSLTT